MSEDPFSGLTDTVHERKRRDEYARKLLRKQKWRAFWASLGAAVLVAAATGAGAACSGWYVERTWAMRTDSNYALDRVLGGLVCGLVGGAFGFFGALWSVMKQEVINDAHSERQDIDIGAVLFWWTVGGVGLLGSIGGALGLTARGPFHNEVLACAVAAALLALIPVVLLRRISVARLTSRTGSERSR